MQQRRYTLELCEPTYYDVEGALPRVPAAAASNSRKRKQRESVATNDCSVHLSALAHLADNPHPSEIRTLSEELLQITLHAEHLLCADASADVLQPAHMARVAWLNEARLRNYALLCRASLSNEHRIALWIARLRCMALASVHCLQLHEETLTKMIADASASASSSSSSSSSLLRRAGNAFQGKHSASLRQARFDALVQRFEDGQRDRELYTAHAVLWPADTPSKNLLQWCTAHRLLPHAIVDMDDSMRACTQATLWAAVRTLLSKWCELPYCAQLVAYYYRLVERVASLSMHTGDARTFNHPVQFKKLDTGEYCINERFLIETERTFFALDSALHRCTYARWPGPRRVAAAASSSCALLGDDALQRFDDFISRELNNGSFLQYVTKDFRVCIFDDLLYPGEMERFEQLRPHDDRKPMTCLARMRRNDFDRYQKMFIDPEIKDIWQTLIKENMYSHPAYTLIASRVLQYYFDSKFDGASFDSYFVAIDHVPLEHLRASVSSALRDYDAEMRTPLTRGSARHALSGTFVRHGLKHTKDSHYAHPLIVRFIGVPAVLRGEQACIVRQSGFSGRITFATAFLTWLHEMVADERLAGTLANGKCIVPLFKELQPTRDTDRVALRAMRIREALHRERSSLTGLEQEVKRIAAAVPQNSDDKKIVF